MVVKDTEGSQPTFTDSSIPQFINSTNVNAITATGFADDVNARIVIQVHLNGQLVKSYETLASFDPQLDKAPWSKLLDGLSDVNDGTLEFTITAIDPSGNSGQLPVFTRIKDTFIALDFTVTPGTTINASQVNAVTVSGTSSEGSAPFDLLVRDGVVAHDITVHIVPDAQGNWSTDPIAGLSGLNQGNITFTATISDNHENSKTTSKTVLLDTISPEDSVLDDPAPIDLNNQGSYEVTGTGEPGATVDVRVIGGGADGPFHTTVGQDHKWKVSNLSVGGRLDGTVTIEATFKDAAGNTTQITKTTTKNTVLVNMVTDPIDLTNYNNVTVSGTGQNGAVVTLIVRDQFNTPLPGSAPSTTIAGGTWSFTGIDLSTLSDGNTTFTANAILSGHQGSSNKIVEKRTVRIGSIATINRANASSLAVSGTGQIGAKVTVKAEDANNAADFVTSNQVTVLANGTWSTTVDVSGLPDGDLKFTATATDEAVPTPHTATSVKTATKDTVVESSTATVPAAFDSSNENSFTITGTSEKGSTVKLVITDGANHTVTPTSVTVNAQGGWTFTGVDVHTLDDGNLKFDFTFTDPFANEFILPTINRTKS